MIRSIVRLVAVCNLFFQYRGKLDAAPFSADTDSGEKNKQKRTLAGLIGMEVCGFMRSCGPYLVPDLRGARSRPSREARVRQGRGGLDPRAKRVYGRCTGNGSSAAGRVSGSTSACDANHASTAARAGGRASGTERWAVALKNSPSCTTLQLFPAVVSSASHGPRRRATARLAQVTVRVTRAWWRTLVAASGPSRTNSVSMSTTRSVDRLHRRHRARRR